MEDFISNQDLLDPNLDLKDKSEEYLVGIATFHFEDDVANAAIKLLRENYDSSYFFCVDCDGLATSYKNCCLNRNLECSNINF